MYNHIVLYGFIIKPKYYAPKNNAEGEGGFCTFKIKCSHFEKGAWEEDWISVTAWGPKLTETVKKADEAGKPIMVEGTLIFSKYSKDGKDGILSSVRASFLRIVLDKKFNQQTPRSPLIKTDLSDDDDLPF